MPLLSGAAESVIFSDYTVLVIVGNPSPLLTVNITVGLKSSITRIAASSLSRAVIQAISWGDITLNVGLGVFVSISAPPDR